MKKLLSFLVCIFAFIGVSCADTKNIDWIVGGNTYAQTSCNVGENVSIPEPAPTTKYGYHIQYTEYIPVEYIESTTVQYVDTGQKATLGTKIELKFKLFNNSGWLYRTETGSSTTLSAYVGTGGTDYWRFNRAGIFVTASDYALDTNISVQDKTGIIVNGIKKGSYSSVGAFTSRENIRFLCYFPKINDYKNESIVSYYFRRKK